MTFSPIAGDNMKYLNRSLLVLSSILLILVVALLLNVANVGHTANLGFINNGLVIQLTTITDADTPFALADEAYLICDTTNSAITVNLPAASTVTGRIYWIKNSGAVAKNVTIDASGSELIDEVLTVTLIDKEALTIVSDGSNWHIM